MFDSQDPQLEFAAAAVREVALLARRVQQTLIGDVITKDDRSPVTVADFAAQAVVAKRLAERFPDDILIGEEDASALRDADSRDTLASITTFVSERIAGATGEDVCDWIDRGAGEPPRSFWTLDPIDGTKGFLRGDQYAVALAYIDRGQVEIGALGCPQLANAQTPQPEGPGTLLVARRGQGTWMAPLDQPQANWQRLQVSPLHDVSAARLLRSVEKGHTNADAIDDLAQSLAISAAPVPMDSQAKYAVLAAGAGEVLLRLLSPQRPDYREKIWDQAAGLRVIEEAGGRVSDLDGRPLDFSHGRTLAQNRGVLATNGALHEQLLEGLRAIGA